MALLCVGSRSKLLGLSEQSSLLIDDALFSVKMHTDVQLLHVFLERPKASSIGRPEYQVAIDKLFLIAPEPVNQLVNSRLPKQARYAHCMWVIRAVQWLTQI